MGIPLWIQQNEIQLCRQGGLTYRRIVCSGRQEPWQRCRKTDRGSCRGDSGSEALSWCQYGKSKIVPLILERLLSWRVWAYRDQDLVTDTWQGSSNQNQLQGVNLVSGTQAKPTVRTRDLVQGHTWKPASKGRKMLGREQAGPSTPQFGTLPS